MGVWPNLGVAAAVGLLLGCGGGARGGTDAVEDVVRVEAAAEGAARETAEVGDAAGKDVPLPAPAALWPEGAAVLEWPAWVEGERAWLKNVSGWAHVLKQVPAQPAEMRYFSDLAVGNRVVFSFVGYKGPFNRFHSMVGPGYERGPSYFGDTWLEVHKAAGAAFSWQKEWLGRVRGTPIVWTQAVNSVVQLSTIDAAVMTETAADPLARAIVRVVMVRNRSAEAQPDLRVDVRFARVQAVQDGAVSEVQEGDRRTVLVLSGEAVEAGPDGLTVTLPALDPGEECTVRMAYLVDDGDESLAETRAALEAAEIAALLAQTRDRWGERLASATRIVTPDPMVDEYVEQALLVIFTQQAAGGAVCPMSQYTHFWMRDSAGPIRFLLGMGMFEEARRILDYTWYGSVTGAAVKNAYPADLDPTLPLPPQPDWESMPVMTGHLAAETPSHVPMMHQWYWNASGKLDFMPERLEMMRHAMWKQAFKGDLLPFSGDETYRAAMAVAHDLPLTEQFEPGYFSSFSSFLWVVGADALAGMCEATGEDEEAKKLRARSAEVREAAEETFRGADGAYLPYVQEGTMAPAPAPFEDVSMFPTWLGYLAADDPLAEKNLEVAIELLGGDDGILVSPLPGQYHDILGLPIKQGIYTGMNPGHYLWALAAAQHPLAEAAFNAMRKHATPTGTVPEYQILDDFAPLHLMYSEIGAEPADYTARYRPWEGGINADSVVFYLLGLRQDALQKRLALAPHLPNGWSWLEARGVRVGETRVDVRIEHPAEAEWKVLLKHTAGNALAVDLALPLPPDGGPVSATVDDKAVEIETVTTTWGTRVGRVSEVALTAGATAVVRVGP